MNPLAFPLLSIVVFLPLAGGGIAWLLGRWPRLAKAWALAVTLADLGLACSVWAVFDYGRTGMQLVDRLAWIEPLGIAYAVGVDGIGLWFLLLTAALGPVAVLLAWKSLSKQAEGGSGAFLFFLLALESGALGVFAAMDLVLFFVFWEAVLIPAYFLVGRWGGERRVTATLKFTVYTMAGSALMLVAILALAALNHEATGVLTFDRETLLGLALPRGSEMWLFLAFALAFAVKAPIWPLHGWLPDAYVEAPAPVTVMLAGVLSKMGIYGLIRLCLPLFPNAVEAARPWVWGLAIAGIVYGLLVALVQSDMKRLAAYTSLAHTGMIVAGLLAANAQGVQGAILQSVSHALTAAALFALVEFLEVRRGTRQIEAFGGLWKSTPILGTLALTAILAAIGVPGLSGFPGEFTMLVGIFLHSRAAALFAGLGIVLGAWTLLTLFRRAFAGPVAHPENRSLPDLRRREAVVMLPLIALIFVLGILPNLVLQPTNRSVDDLLRRSEERRVVLMDRSADRVASSR